MLRRMTFFYAIYGKFSYLCLMKIFESDSRFDIVSLQYAFAPTPFGEVLTASDEWGLCYAGFVIDGDRRAALADLERRFPNARLERNDAVQVDIFGNVGALHLAGTPFQRRVWRTLLTVGRGGCISYSALAAQAGVPRAVRATASAVAANPLSIVVPCHRVVRNDGATGNYFWGAELKRRLLESEGVKMSEAN